MSEQQDPPPDVTTVPNFPALTGWIEKLASWCEGAVAKIAHQDTEIRELKTRLDDQDKELAQQKHTDDEVDSIIEFVEDIVRGVRTLEELADHLGVRP